MTKKRHNSSFALVDLTGEIRAADLDEGTFVLRLSDGTRVRGKFSRAQETIITRALREHARRRVHLRGRGEYQRNGRLKRVVSVKQLRVKPAREKRFDKTARPIWEVLEELGKSIPKKDWAKVPRDGAQNLNHYLYGHAKRD